MAGVFYVHWNEAELKERMSELAAAGHEVRGHGSTSTTFRWGEWMPDAVVISLDRLPSHGRAVAEWIVEAKKRKQIVIIFAGGLPDKVEATRAKFPDAIYCSSESVAETLARITGE
jgi:hypothetical protein